MTGGYGTSQQLVAGVPLSALRYIFITHHHSDHNLEYGSVVYNGWATGLANRVMPALESILKRVSNATTLREHLIASHTVPEDVGRVAAAAAVKTVVLSDVVPGDDASVTDEMWSEVCASISRAGSSWAPT